MIKRIFLDTNIILQFPEIFLSSNSEKKFIIPDIVIEEIKNLNNEQIVENTLRIIKSLEASHQLKIINSEEFNKISYISLKKGIKLFHVVYSNIILDYTYSHKDAEIFLITNDKEFLDFCISKKIKAYTIEYFKNSKTNITENKSANDEIVKNIQVLRQKRNNELLSILSTAVVSSFLTFVITTYFYFILNFLLEYKSIWINILIFIIIIALGFLIFYFRAKRRLYYGIIEFVIGVYSALDSLSKTNLLDVENFSTLVKLSAGFYIMVRGLENFGKGLKISSNQKLFGIWIKFFPENN
jgi:cytochrome c biogenesis protein CcdA